MPFVTATEEPPARPVVAVPVLFWPMTKLPPSAAEADLLTTRPPVAAAAATMAPLPSRERRLDGGASTSGTPDSLTDSVVDTLCPPDFLESTRSADPRRPAAARHV